MVWYSLASIAVSLISVKVVSQEQIFEGEDTQYWVRMRLPFISCLVQEVLASSVDLVASLDIFFAFSKRQKACGLRDSSKT